MFGLMKNTSCSQSNQPDWYRLHYCGTCKSLGQIYGQRSRLFLNHDIVFLAEILSLLQESQTQNWDKALHSKKCFELPKEENLPLSLQYAADINTLLVELKVRDNLSDDFSQVWKLAKRFLNRPFSKIQERVEKWGIDIQELLDLQLVDFNREISNPSQKTIWELLSFHAEPSAKITGYLFAKGTEVIEKTNEQDTIYQIGFAFGELTYALDAWKDLENDEEEGNFNPLLFFPKRSIEDRKSETANWIWDKADEIKNLLEEINIEEKIKQSIQGRLQMNLAAVLSEDSKVVRPSTGIGKSTVPTVVRTISKTYEQITSWVNPMRPTRFVVGYLVFFFVFFQQKLIAAVDIFKEPENLNSDQFLLAAGLTAVPVGLYYGGRKLKRNRKRITRRIKRQKRRLLRRLKRAGRKLKTEREGLEGWKILLIILGAVVIILLLITLLFIAGINSATEDCGSSSSSDDSCCE